MKKLILALAVAAATTSSLAANHIRMPVPGLVGQLASHPAVAGFGAVSPVPEVPVEPEVPVVPPQGSLAGINFGSIVAGATVDLDAVLRNTGEVPLVLNSMPGTQSLSGSAAFSFVGTTCAASLAVAETCAIKVRFTGPAQPGALTSDLRVDTAAGLLTASLTGTSTSQTITFKLGAAGSSAYPVSNYYNTGTPGGATTFSYSGISVTAGGGAGGRLGYFMEAAAGGVGTGGTARVPGGSGGKGSTGGGGGGGIGGTNGADSLYHGGTGGTGVDFGGLRTAVVAANFQFGAPGVGARNLGIEDVAESGGNAVGVGGGGGGAGYMYGDGGNGLYGGGGAGSTGNAGYSKGGHGGQGIIVVLFVDSTAVILTNGTSYTPSKAVKRIWAVGAGGGGSGSYASNEHGYGGGGAGGGAGAVVYQDF
jgi:hypothetical protein